MFMENNLPEMLVEAVAVARGRLGGRTPLVGVVLGSGLGQVADRLDDAVVIPYDCVPHLPCSTAHMHEGRFVCGFLNGVCTLVMQGRLHEYEGYSPVQVAFPIWLMAELGVNTLVATNAVGAINAAYQVNDLVLMRDHINFSLGNPLANQGAARLHNRFTSMTDAYDPQLREMALAAAKDLGLPAHEGVYVGVKGPSFETPAEIRAFRMMGADTVGMSTVGEVIAARHAGMRVLGVSYVMNMAAGMTEGHPIAGDLQAIVSKGSSDMFRLLEKLIPRF